MDADKFCNVTWFFGYKSGQVIACLRCVCAASKPRCGCAHAELAAAACSIRDVKDRLAPGCKREVFKVQMDAALDYRADSMLYEACKADSDSLCKDVKQGGGRVQACLVRHAGFTPRCVHRTVCLACLDVSEHPLTSSPYACPRSCSGPSACSCPGPARSSCSGRRWKTRMTSGSAYACSQSA